MINNFTDKDSTTFPLESTNFICIIHLYCIIFLQHDILKQFFLGFFLEELVVLKNFDAEGSWEDGMANLFNFTKIFTSGYL